MYLKPSDLGPVYKEPIFAEVYIMVVNDPEDYLFSKNKRDIILELDLNIYDIYMNIYLHDRLKQ